MSEIRIMIRLRNNYILLTLLVLFFISGCNFSGNFFGLKDGLYWDSYVKWRHARLDELKPFIGKSKEQIKSSFGKPTYIDYNTLTNGLTFDEEWTYKYEEGLPIINSSSYSYTFYFDKENAVAVDVD
jgi:hypothetical protein